MSYILDALRRADAERERGAVPGVHTRQFSPPHQEQERSRRSQWPLWTIVGLSVALVAALAWNFLGRGPAVPAEPPLASLRPEALPPGLAPAPSPMTGTSLPPTGAGSPAPIVTASSEAPPARTAATPSDTGATAADTGGTPARTGAALPTATRTSPEAPIPTRPTRRTAPTSTANAPSVAAPPTEAVAQGTRSQPTPPPRAKPHPTATVASAEADPDQAVEPRSQAAAAAVPKPSGGRPQTAATEQRELPESMRKELPPIAVSGSAYSPNKASRMLLANGQVFHEGDSVANGLVLQQIKPRSAVFDYKGYRYEMPF